MPLQSVCGATHAHVLDWHVRPPAQAMAHIPQCALSDVRLAHEVPHNIGAVAGHPETQANEFPDGPQLGVPPVHFVVQSPQ